MTKQKRSVHGLAISQVSVYFSESGGGGKSGWKGAWRELPKGQSCSIYWDGCWFFQFVKTPLRWTLKMHFSMFMWQVNETKQNLQTLETGFLPFHFPLVVTLWIRAPNQWMLLTWAELSVREAGSLMLSGKDKNPTNQPNSFCVQNISLKTYRIKKPSEPTKTQMSSEVGWDKVTS